MPDEKLSCSAVAGTEKVTAGRCVCDSHLCEFVISPNDGIVNME